MRETKLNHLIHKGTSLATYMYYKQEIHNNSIAEIL